MSSDNFNVALLVAISGVAVLVITVALPVMLTMRQAAKDREFQHAERLKALEMGRALPGDPNHDGSSKAAGAGIGVWMPLGALGIALAATRGSINTEAADVAIWVSAGTVGVTGVICGTVLAARASMREGQEPAHFTPAKHAFDESEIDTVSRRGA